MEAPPIVAESSAPGKRAPHLAQNKLPRGLVWPQVGQAIVDFTVSVDPYCRLFLLDGSSMRHMSAILRHAIDSKQEPEAENF
jgi:hypothetical protein